MGKWSFCFIIYKDVGKKQSLKEIWMFENRKRGIKSVELKSRMREQILLEHSETNKKIT